MRTRKPAAAASLCSDAAARKEEMATFGEIEKLSVTEVCVWLSQKLNEEVQEESIDVLSERKVFLEVNRRRLQRAIPTVRRTKGGI